MITNALQNLALFWPNSWSFLRFHLTSNQRLRKEGWDLSYMYLEAIFLKSCHFGSHDFESEELLRFTNILSVLNNNVLCRCPIRDTSKKRKKCRASYLLKKKRVGSVEVVETQLCAERRSTITQDSEQLLLQNWGFPAELLILDTILSNYCCNICSKVCVWEGGGSAFYCPPSS